MKGERVVWFGTIAAVLALAVVSGAAYSQPYPYTPLPGGPCRAVDTRDATYTEWGPPALTSGVIRSFRIKGLRCGIPSDAKAVTLNLTVTGPALAGFVILWPTDAAMPPVSNINFVAGEPAIANGAVVKLGANLPDLSAVYGVGGGSGTVQLILDVTGYYK